MSIIVDLADEVKAHIQPLTLSESHSTDRVYTLDLNSENIDGAMVHVLPTPPEVSLYNRSNYQWDISINVVLTTRVGHSPAATVISLIDVAMDDVEILMDAFKGVSFTINSKTHRVLGITQASIYDDVTLRDDGVFQSVFTIGFKVIR